MMHTAIRDNWAIPDEAVKGAEFVLTRSMGDHQVFSIRGIIDGRAVCRHWNARHSRWEYETFGPAWFRGKVNHIEWRQAA
ncbi:hypothetical protein [uncultured Hyphomonas sp.]|uniref:hypothetical protein n=2 Tax=Hyphomonas TaxID=85 RepID=UPI000C5FC63E|nr:hypothetical protein [Hyphomonadaceae bacterium]MBA30104.1 hypothetical protein [Hyphomonadaceae bacterium]QDP63711.1 MAG: hypothetical protein GOVbin258_39 [Prokaryotic dsDNA virus sp.]|tara:strand:- start:25835 stop:26074 length:240 start_codon:yes stop_codon:yes gene_type:complete